MKLEALKHCMTLAEGLCKSPDLDVSGALQKEIRDLMWPYYTAISDGVPNKTALNRHLPPDKLERLINAFEVLHDALEEKGEGTQAQDCRAQIKIWRFRQRGVCGHPTYTYNDTLICCTKDLGHEGDHGTPPVRPPQVISTRAKRWAKKA